MLEADHHARARVLDAGISYISAVDHDHGPVRQHGTVWPGRLQRLAPDHAYAMTHPRRRLLLPVYSRGDVCGSLCAREDSVSTDQRTLSMHLDSTGRDDVLSGGVKRIPVATPKGPFHVWTKRIGNYRTMKVLLLH